MTCETCQHWHELEEGDNGFCRRHPPRVFMFARHYEEDGQPMMGQVEASACPKTGRYWTCGEWKERT